MEVDQDGQVVPMEMPGPVLLEPTVLLAACGQSPHLSYLSTHLDTLDMWPWRGQQGPCYTVGGALEASGPGL